MADRYVGSRVFLFSPSYFCSSSLLQFCRGVKCVFAVSLFSELLLQLSALLSSSSPAAVFAHFPKCFLATKPSPEQDPNSPTTHRDIVDDDTDDDDDDDDEKHMLIR